MFSARYTANNLHSTVHIMKVCICSVKCPPTDLLIASERLEKIFKMMLNAQLLTLTEMILKFVLQEEFKIKWNAELSGTLFCTHWTFRSVRYLNTSSCLDLGIASVPLYMVGSGRAESPWLCNCRCCSKRLFASRTGFSNWVLRLMWLKYTIQQKTQHNTKHINDSGKKFSSLLEHNARTSV